MGKSAQNVIKGHMHCKPIKLLCIPLCDSTKEQNTYLFMSINEYHN